MKKLKKIMILVFFLVFLGACSNQIEKNSDINQRAVVRDPNEQSSDFSQSVESKDDDSPNINIDDSPQDEKTESIYDDQMEKYVKTTFYHHDKNLIAPLILIDSEDVSRINQEIKERVMEEAKNSNEADPIFMTYASYLNHDILSVLVQIDKQNVSEFLYYNINIKTGKKMTRDQILELNNLTWEKARDIFYGERTAYWKGVSKKSDNFLNSREYVQKEINYLDEYYAEDKAPLIIAGDGLIAVVCILLDQDKNSYWDFYHLSSNRVALLQSNTYASEFPAVIIESPTEEEISSLKIIKRISSSKDKSAYKNFLVLPLWEDLDFSWGKKMSSDETSTDVLFDGLEELNHLIAGEAIYIEISKAEIDRLYYQAIIKKGNDQVAFSPKDFNTVSKKENGILYLPLRYN